MSAHRAHNFDGRLKPTAQRKRATFSQADTVRQLLAYDQHGRPYDGVIQLKSNAPTGPLHPKFIAPIYPDPKWIIVNPENPQELFVDMKGWYLSRKQNEQDHHKRAVRLSAKKGWPEPKFGQYSEQVEEELGVLPPTSASIVVAALYQENPWLIGACRGCSTKDRRTGEFQPRFSHNCACPGGYEPFPADPRLKKYVERPDADILDDEIEDFSVDAYAEATGQSVEEVQARPTQFRRISRVPTADGPAQLADDTVQQTEKIEVLGTKLSEADEAELNAAIDQLDAVEDEDAMFERPELEAAIDADEVEEVADPAALGGKTVPPKAQERVAGQAPRVGNASTKTQRGAHASAKGSAKGQTVRGRTRAEVIKKVRQARGDTRPSLADGAKPVTGS